MSSCKTDSEDIITRLRYIYLEYLRFVEASDKLILVHYIVWHPLFVLESGLFNFVKLDGKVLEPIAFLATNFEQVFQAFCLALLPLTAENDLLISLVIHLSDVIHAAPEFSLATLDKSILISYFDCEI